MKRVYKALAISLCLSFCCINGTAQQLLWAHSTGSSAIETSNILHTDNAGNVYTAGKFAGTNVDFDPSPTGTFLLSTVGSSDAFVAKYTATGQFVWAFRFGGTSRDEVYGIKVDEARNAFY